MIPGGVERRTGVLPSSAALAVLLSSVAAGCGSADGAVERGDRLAASERLQEAAAEYQLAIRREGRRTEVLARLAEVKVRQGELGESIDLYGELLEADSAFRPAAAAGLLSLAEEARREGQTDRMLRALEPVLEIGLDWVSDSLRLAAAEGFWERGDPARALPLYLSVVGAPEEIESTGVLLHVARSYEDLGGCTEALPYFSEYLDRVRSPGARRTSAQWHYGSCLFEVAGRHREAGESRDAAETLSRLLELGAPRPLMDDAHYARGEALLALGRQEDAREDFEAVLRMNPARSGPLVQQAERRLRELRYGGS